MDILRHTFEQPGPGCLYLLFALVKTILDKTPQKPFVAIKFTWLYKGEWYH